MDSLNLEVTNMSQKKNLSTKTDCVICNILQTDLLDEESTNDWLIENYSGKNSEALSITSLTNWFNEHLLQRLYVKQHPNTNPTFDFITLREYIEKVYLDRDDQIDPKLFSLGKSIIEHFQLDPVDLSTRLISRHNMQTHLKKCLKVEEPEKDNLREMAISKLLQAADFSAKILIPPLEFATNNSIAPPNIQFITYARTDTGEMLPIKEWIMSLKKEQ